MTQSEDDDLTGPFEHRRVTWQERAEFLRQDATILQQTTIDSYRKANMQQSFVGRSLRSPIAYNLLDSGERDSYYQSRPRVDGVMTWSRVGFNADGTQALFYESYRGGRTRDCGHYLVLEKENGIWMVQKDILVWNRTYD